uniref:Protein kinase n=1 Tax=Staphylothermus marinus TaxID=2280 RepID=A0A7C4HBJ7_STAMA
MVSFKKLLLNLTRFSKREREGKKVEEVVDVVKSSLLISEPVHIVTRDPSLRVFESYYVYKPFVKVSIAESPEGLMYYVEEYGLTPEDKLILDKLSEILMDEIKPPASQSEVKDLRRYVYTEVERIVEKYRTKFGLHSTRRIKLMYYVERNLIGFGPIDPLMRDPNIEDISCNGVGVPVYVWHRKYESIPTNIVFVDEDYLNEFIMKLTHMAGKHISIAFPIVDAMLPGKHRLAATFSREVSVKGPTFTVRKFREKPFSVTELITQKTIDPLLAAYLWTMIEHMKTAMIAGGTGTGKTTLLNVISLFIKPGMKIVTVEETPELNLPHSNWVQLTTRESYLVGLREAGTDIKLYDLVRLSLRYRPDYVIVGEVRGEEAYVLFQSLATGHGGLSTIHAETLDYAIKRLTSQPMNIPPAYIKLMNIFIHLNRVVTRIEKGIVKVNRRISVVQEVVDENNFINIAKWDPRTDSYIIDFSNSYHIKDIAEKRGWDFEDVIEEIYRKATVLNWMIYRNILDVWDVSKVVFNYYIDPQSVYRRAVEELEKAAVKGVEVVKEKPSEAVVVEETGETKELGEATRELFERTRELGK